MLTRLRVGGRRARRRRSSEARRPPRTGRGRGALHAAGRPLNVPGTPLRAPRGVFVANVALRIPQERTTSGGCIVGKVRTVDTDKSLGGWGAISSRSATRLLIVGLVTLALLAVTSAVLVIRNGRLPTGPAAIPGAIVDAVQHVGRPDRAPAAERDGSGAGGNQAVRAGNRSRRIDVAVTPRLGAPGAAGLSAAGLSLGTRHADQPRLAGGPAPRRSSVPST